MPATSNRSEDTNTQSSHNHPDHHDAARFAAGARRKVKKRNRKQHNNVQQDLASSSLSERKTKSNNKKNQGQKKKTALSPLPQTESWSQPQPPTSISIINTNDINDDNENENPTSPAAETTKMTASSSTTNNKGSPTSVAALETQYLATEDACGIRWPSPTESMKQEEDDNDDDDDMLDKELLTTTTNQEVMSKNNEQPKTTKSVSTRSTRRDDEAQGTSTAPLLLNVGTMIQIKKSNLNAVVSLPPVTTKTTIIPSRHVEVSLENEEEEAYSLPAKPPTSRTVNATTDTTSRDVGTKQEHPRNSRNTGSKTNSIQQKVLETNDDQQQDKKRDVVNDNGNDTPSEAARHIRVVDPGDTTATDSNYYAPASDDGRQHTPSAIEPSKSTDTKRFNNTSNHTTTMTSLLDASGNWTTCELYSGKEIGASSAGGGGVVVNQKDGPSPSSTTIEKIDGDGKKRRQYHDPTDDEVSSQSSSSDQEEEAGDRTTCPSLQSFSMTGSSNNNHNNKRSTATSTPFIMPPTTTTNTMNHAELEDYRKALLVSSSSGQKHKKEKEEMGIIIIDGSTTEYDRSSLFVSKKPEKEEENQYVCPSLFSSKGGGGSTLSTTTPLLLVPDHDGGDGNHNTMAIRGGGGGNEESGLGLLEGGAPTKKILTPQHQDDNDMILVSNDHPQGEDYACPSLFSTKGKLASPILVVQRSQIKGDIRRDTTVDRNGSNLEYQIEQGDGSISDHSRGEEYTCPSLFSKKAAQATPFIVPDDRSRYVRSRDIVSSDGSVPEDQLMEAPRNGDVSVSDRQDKDYSCPSFFSMNKPASPLFVQRDDKRRDVSQDVSSIESGPGSQLKVATGEVDTSGSVPNYEEYTCPSLFSMSKAASPFVVHGGGRSRDISLGSKGGYKYDTTSHNLGPPSRESTEAKSLQPSIQAAERSDHEGGISIRLLSVEQSSDQQVQKTAPSLGDMASLGTILHSNDKVSSDLDPQMKKDTTDGGSLSIGGQKDRVCPSVFSTNKRDMRFLPPSNDDAKLEFYGKASSDPEAGIIKGSPEHHSLSDQRGKEYACPSLFPSKGTLSSLFVAQSNGDVDLPGGDRETDPGGQTKKPIEEDVLVSGQQDVYTCSSLFSTKGKLLATPIVPYDDSRFVSGEVGVNESDPKTEIKSALDDTKSASDHQAEYTCPSIFPMKKPASPFVVQRNDGKYIGSSGSDPEVKTEEAAKEYVSVADQEGQDTCLSIFSMGKSAPALFVDGGDMRDVGGNLENFQTQNDVKPEDMSGSFERADHSCPSLFSRKTGMLWFDISSGDDSQLLGIISSKPGNQASTPLVSTGTQPIHPEWSTIDKELENDTERSILSFGPIILQDHKNEIDLEKGNQESQVPSLAPTAFKVTKAKYALDKQLDQCTDLAIGASVPMIKSDQEDNLMDSEGKIVDLEAQIKDSVDPSFLSDKQEAHVWLPVSSADKSSTRLNSRQAGDFPSGGKVIDNETISSEDQQQDQSRSILFSMDKPSTPFVLKNTDDFHSGDKSFDPEALLTETTEDCSLSDQQENDDTPSLVTLGNLSTPLVDRKDGSLSSRNKESDPEAQNEEDIDHSSAADQQGDYACASLFSLGIPSAPFSFSRDGSEGVDDSGPHPKAKTKDSTSGQPERLTCPPFFASGTMVSPLIEDEDAEVRTDRIGPVLGENKDNAGSASHGYCPARLFRVGNAGSSLIAVDKHHQGDHVDTAPAMEVVESLYPHDQSSEPVISQKQRRPAKIIASAGHIDGDEFVRSGTSSPMGAGEYVDEAGAENGYSCPALLPIGATPMAFVAKNEQFYPDPLDRTTTINVATGSLSDSDTEDGHTCPGLFSRRTSDKHLLQTDVPEVSSTTASPDYSSEPSNIHLSGVSNRAAQAPFIAMDDTMPSNMVSPATAIANNLAHNSGPDRCDGLVPRDTSSKTFAAEQAQLVTSTLLLGSGEGTEPTDITKSRPKTAEPWTSPLSLSQQQPSQAMFRNDTGVDPAATDDILSDAQTEKVKLSDTAPLYHLDGAKLKTCPPGNKDKRGNISIASLEEDVAAERDVENITSSLIDLSPTAVAQTKPPVAQLVPSYAWKLHQLLVDASAQRSRLITLVNVQIISLTPLTITAAVFYAHNFDGYPPLDDIFAVALFLSTVCFPMYILYLIQRRKGVLASEDLDWQAAVRVESEIFKFRAQVGDYDYNGDSVDEDRNDNLNEDQKIRFRDEMQTLWEVARELDELPPHIWDDEPDDFAASETTPSEQTRLLQDQEVVDGDDRRTMMNLDQYIHHRVDTVRTKLSDLMETRKQQENLMRQAITVITVAGSIVALLTLEWLVPALLAVAAAGGSALEVASFQKTIEVSDELVQSLDTIRQEWSESVDCVDEMGDYHQAEGARLVEAVEAAILFSKLDKRWEH